MLKHTIGFWGEGAGYVTYSRHFWRYKLFNLFESQKPTPKPVDAAPRSLFTGLEEYYFIFQSTCIKPEGTAWSQWASLESVSVGDEDSKF